ncbi:hypothetical protein E2C01_090491 [Portunus trituberculatus]|uniref:Uncharacterized protein n=1 Tax=Portunus trituberculatus TaxID=210409 RepID=A0A5B7JQH3_PORTR|nr:hypothetical protein [Portunus trituberculatus]
MLQYFLTIRGDSEDNTFIAPEKLRSHNNLKLTRPPRPLHIPHLHTPHPDTPHSTPQHHAPDKPHPTPHTDTPHTPHPTGTLRHPTPTQHTPHPAHTQRRMKGSRSSLPPDGS